MIYLRILDVEQLKDADVSALIRALPFGNAERTRLLSFGSKHRQLESLAALMLIESVMKEAGHSDADLSITRDGADGKPRFCAPNMPLFSISHSCGYVGVALGDCEVGLDVELLRGRPHKADLAKRFFTREEREAFEKAGGTDETFMLLWTQKEALVKLHGASLADSLYDELSGEGLYSDIICVSGGELAVSLYAEERQDVDTRIITL